MRDHADGLHPVVLFITGLLPYKEGLLPVLLPTLWGEGWRAVDTVSAESGSRLPVAAYCVHASLPVLVPGVPQPVITGRCGAGDIHGNPHMGPGPAVASTYPFIDNGRWCDVRSHLEKPSFLRP